MTDVTPSPDIVPDITPRPEPVNQTPQVTITTGTGTATFNPVVVSPAPSVEPGYTTTEFWLTTAVSLITEAEGLIVAFGGSITPQQQAAVIAATQGVVGAIVAIYALVRTWRKNS